MATLTQTVGQPPRPSPWLWEFLKEELAPYPGRLGTVARMVIAATLVMVICMTFRIPYGFQGATYALIISRENLRATLKSAGIILLFTVIGAAYVLISAWFVAGVPILHFLWNIGSFLLAFYALSVINNYGVASTFAIMIAVGVPLWDRQVPAETNVEDTLWLLLAASVGVMVTAAVEAAFSRTGPEDDMVLHIAERLTAVESLLACYAENCPVDHATKKKVVTLAMRGTSTLRRFLRRSDYSSQYQAQMSGVVALVGRLVDIAATMTQFSFEPSGADQKRLRDLSATVASLHADLVNRRIPGAIQFDPDDETSQGIPMLREMEKIVSLIPQAFAPSRSADENFLPLDDAPRSMLVAPDALANPEHLKFALKGCLAAGLCYVIYNSIAWPGISTAVTTCLLTALSTVGSSRQKQVLRFAGAVVGGFLIGMGSQILILPYLDSIYGFTLLFIFVTAPASWVMTSSPRLSYFGLQVAFAFYLINLQEFAFQTSLSVARDRVVGVLLGLIMMWLVFDRLWRVPAGLGLKRGFASTLRLLAQLAREPVSKDIPAAVKRSFALRETINADFDKVRSLADGVLFEFGPTRQQDLALRDRIRLWQPQLRTLFLMRVASLKYRFQAPGFELPESVRLSQEAYDDRSARMLEDIADRIEGQAPRVRPVVEEPSGLLERTLEACRAQQSPQLPAGRVQSFVTLLRGIDSLTTSMAEDIATQ